jgi:hypothetical protein
MSETFSLFALILLRSQDGLDGRPQFRRTLRVNRINRRRALSNRAEAAESDDSAATRKRGFRPAGGSKCGCANRM